MRAYAILCWLFINYHQLSSFPLQRRPSKDISSKPRPPSRPIPVTGEEESDLNGVTRIAEEERLQKVISRAGIASRRAAEQMILDGRVAVNGNIVTELGMKVRTRKDTVLVDGVKVSLPDAKSLLWVVVNKPRGILTTMDDDKDRETIHSLIPRAKDLRLLSVGRLDRDTTGVMLLTNDNGWIHPLTHPSFIHKRRYEVLVKGVPGETALENLRKGVMLEGERILLRPSTVMVVDVDRKSGFSVLDFQIDEQLPRQVQRMVEYLGCEMLSLKRTEFGPIKLKGLKKGDWRELTQVEVEKLKASCVKAPSAGLTTKRRPRLLAAKGPGSGYSTRVKDTADGLDKRRRLFRSPRSGQKSITKP